MLKDTRRNSIGSVYVKVTQNTHIIKSRTYCVETIKQQVLKFRLSSIICRTQMPLELVDYKDLCVLARASYKCVKAPWSQTCYTVRFVEKISVNDYIPQER